MKFYVSQVQSYSCNYINQSEVCNSLDRCKNIESLIHQTIGSHLQQMFILLWDHMNHTTDHICTFYWLKMFFCFFWCCQQTGSRLTFQPHRLQICSPIMQCNNNIPVKNNREWITRVSHIPWKKDTWSLYFIKCISSM